MLFGSSGMLCAADIGAALPLEDKATVDGWGGVQVRFGESLPPGEAVTIVQYYADDDRAGVIDTFRFVPLVVQQEGGSLAGDAYGCQATESRKSPPKKNSPKVGG